MSRFFAETPPETSHSVGHFFFKAPWKLSVLAALWRSAAPRGGPSVVCQSALALQLRFFPRKLKKSAPKRAGQGLNVRDPGASDTRSERIKREKSCRGDGSSPVVGA